MVLFSQKLMISLFAGLVYYLVERFVRYSSFIKTCVFFMITLLTMGDLRKNLMIKLRHSFYGTLIYYFIANENFTNNNIYNTILYIISLILVMYLP